VNLKIELIHDEPDFFRFTRVGNWIYGLDYETGENTWTWFPEVKDGLPEHVHETPSEASGL
jgi:hypothetical protein